MKQLTLFDGADKPLKQTSSSWHISIDGASRNNPGPSGAGIFITKNKEVVYKEGFYLGKKTNNQAEYIALLIALFFLHEHAHHDDQIHIISDSELLVKQIRGIYKVRNEDLKVFHTYACKQLEKYSHLKISHVLRENNTKADLLANAGITEKKLLPHPFILHMKHHGISL